MFPDVFCPWLFFLPFFPRGPLWSSRSHSFLQWWCCFPSAWLNTTCYSCYFSESYCTLKFPLFKTEFFPPFMSTFQLPSRYIKKAKLQVRKIATAATTKSKPLNYLIYACFRSSPSFFRQPPSLSPCRRLCSCLASCACGGQVLLIFQMKHFLRLDFTLPRSGSAS